MSVSEPEIQVDRKFVFSKLEIPPLVVFDAKLDSILQETYTEGIFMNHKLEFPTGFMTLKHCDTLLSSLLRIPELEQFQKPVDPKKLNCVNYFETIKNPMDLSTLQKLLRSGAIPSVLEFKRNLDLIWDNCITFNGEESEIAKKAIGIKNTIAENWKKCQSAPKTNIYEDLVSLQKTLEDFHQIMRNTIKVPPKISFGEMPKAQAALPPRNISSQNDSPPTQSQLLHMIEKLNNTPYNQMKSAWDLITPHIDLKQNTLQISNLPPSVQVELKKLLLK